MTMKILLAPFMFLIVFQTYSFSQSTLHYIDKSATGNNNGTSWQNAWQSFSAISWNSIKAGDTVYISGGTDSTIYYETLKIPDGKSGSQGSPIVITKGIDTGHNGIVILDGSNIPDSPAVYISNCSYITISNLYTRYWLSYLTNLGTFFVDGSDHIIIENNKILAWDQGLKISNSNNCIFRNNSYETPAFIANQTDGIYATFNTDNIYEGNYINISNGSPDDHNDCFQGQNEGPCIIRDNIFMHSGASALKPIHSQGIFDKYSNGLHQYINNLIYMPNKSTSTQEMDDAVLDQQNPTSQYPGNGQPASVIAINNTVVGASTHTFGFQTSNLIAKNNLVILLDNIAEIRYPSGINKSDIDYNLYYANNQVGNIIIGAQYSLSDWQGMGYDMHSINADPKLTPGFLLKPGSPAIDAGTDVSTYGVTTDIEGNHRPYGSNYDIGAYEYQGFTSTENDVTTTPKNFVLFQNYPNPFNPGTNISFSIPSPGIVKIVIYDMLGKEVAELINSELPAGKHSIYFNGSNVSSGLYIYTLEADNFKASKKMLLLK